MIVSFECACVGHGHLFPTATTQGYLLHIGSVGSFVLYVICYKCLLQNRFSCFRPDIDAGVTTRLDKSGYYEFDANQPEAMLFKGQAKSEVADGKWREIKGHHELALTSGENGQLLTKEKPADFDPNAPDELYNWSSLRSQYLAEANNEMAGEHYGAGYDPGWFWDPYALGYTYMGMEPFASPFGWGYYPFGWGRFMGGYYGGGGWYGGRGGHGPYRYGGYHGGSRGVYGRGFHSSGGFHGAGGGGFQGGGGGHR